MTKTQIENLARSYKIPLEAILLQENTYKVFIIIRPVPFTKELFEFCAEIRELTPVNSIYQVAMEI